jgi:error-prone DNA polymerase
MPVYAELQVTSNFSFLRGASHPEELVKTAQLYGYRAIAITDRNSVAGIVRAHVMARELKTQERGIKLTIGARLDFEDAPSVLCFPRDRIAYGRLTTLLTVGKRRAEKGQCRLYRDELFAYSEGQIIVALAPEKIDGAFADHLRLLRAQLSTLYLALNHFYHGDDAQRLQTLANLAHRCRIDLVATNDVHYHVAGRRPLQDVLTCVREGCTIRDAGYRLYANAERHLKPPEEMAELFRQYPDAVANTVEIAAAAKFSIEDLKYEYPEEPIRSGLTPQEELERLAWIGAEQSYPQGVPDKVRTQIVAELALIAECNYARYFLTIRDIIDYAKGQNILYQGRGSAANSALCFVLGITQIDPVRRKLLFARFLSTERHEPPDIDVDFEHERREEVIQYIYKKYGRDRAGIAATVICYRPRSALRDVGKALGLSQDMVNTLSKSVWSWGRGGFEDAYIREAGLDPADPTLKMVVELTEELVGFPRHLSQHVGGFIITKGPLHELVPIENASMEDRTIIEWDKDDLDAAGLFKIDVLALGMLSCLRRGFAMLEAHYGVRRSLYDVPAKDPATYKMIQKADTIGVFQIESRAQMSMLPRLRPEKFYDLVIEVAIVRPGPIQGGMVHPYLKRREGKEKVSYPSEALEDVLYRTLGVPLFQEQAMQIAIVGAGFTPEKADKLRRAMATFKRSGTIGTLCEEFINGMLANGYKQDFAQSCFKQIEGFADYGFPESHAASFALLVYTSAWMKCHYPAVFAAALLNSQPMGFYAPAQILRDARDHGVEVRPIDVNHSEWDCTLERVAVGTHALRLGFRQVKGFSEEDAKKLVNNRAGFYVTLRDAWRRTHLDKRALAALADADAWGSFGLSRRDALWQISGLTDNELPLFAAAEDRRVSGYNGPPEVISEPDVILPRMKLGAQVIEDYRHLGFSLKRHPMAFLRGRMNIHGIVPCQRLKEMSNGDPVVVAGLVLVRQQPGTAKGVIFITLEDEGGIANIVVWSRTFEAYRKALLVSRLMVVEGTVQREGAVVHVVAEKLIDRSDDLHLLSQEDGKFELAMARADHVRRPGHDPRDAIPEGRNFH